MGFKRLGLHVLCYFVEIASRYVRIDTTYTRCTVRSPLDFLQDRRAFLLKMRACLLYTEVDFPTNAAR